MGGGGIRPIPGNKTYGWFITGLECDSEEDVHSASKQDFIACLELYDSLFERRVVSMSEVEETYREIFKSMVSLQP
jgi:hypothetical protein